MVFEIIFVVRVPMKKTCCQNYRSIGVVFSVVLFVLTTQTLFAGHFIDIGTSGLYSWARGVSGDGRVVVGYEGGNAFKYVDGEKFLLEGLVPRSEALVFKASYDGSVIIGISDQDPSCRAVKWVNGALVDLGIFSEGMQSFAEGVSSDGKTIVGCLYSDDTETNFAVKWDETGMVVLPNLPEDRHSCAWDASEGGSVIVGDAMGSEEIAKAVYWKDGEQHLLSNIPGAKRSSAHAVSKDGSFIVGEFISEENEVHAFVYHNGVIKDIGTLGGDYSVATGVSRDGKVIVGHSTRTDGEYRAFKYVDGRMIDLGTLGGSASFAFGVSDDGKTIVGKFETELGECHAFIYLDD
uniref:Uncharacterized protein n=2 Tax=Chlamydia pneumoniae TaxID=83558 RepID=A0A0F7XR83_CHLPN|nr:Uncharacterized protein BN1224_UZG1_B_01250 [Chlamydia pneumoniae]